MPPEQRAKIAAALRGRPRPPGAGAMTRVALLGNRNAAGHRVTGPQRANLRQNRPKGKTDASD